MDNTGLIVSALELTDEKLCSSIDGKNSWSAAVLKRGARVKLYRAYDEGNHRSDLTNQMRAMLRLKADAAGLNEFCDNYASIVLDKMSGRVSVEEISTGNPTTDKNWLEPLLTKQDFQASEGMWWRGAICDGDAFVMVDPKTLLWSSEPAFDGFSGMVAIYNQMTRKPVWACKVWAESDTKDLSEEGGGTPKVMHMVVYQPTKISYWEGQEGGSEVTASKGEDGETSKTWPAELNGYLPFVSYANDRNNYTRYGNSEIRKAIPLQDVLNRTMHSMVMASEFAAFPVNISIGMNMDVGGIAPGAVVNLVLRDSLGAVITSFTAEQIAFLQACKVTQLPPANLAQYTEQIVTIVKEISQATQTPIYGITAGGAISGDALKQLEIGLIGKVLRFQRQNKDALKELIMLTALMERTFQPGLGTPEITEVDITWKSPELLDVNVQVAALKDMYKDMPGIWSDHFYQVKIGQLFGMSKDDIEAEILAADKEKEAKLKAMKDLQPSSIFGNNAAGDNTPGDSAQGGETVGAEEPVNADMTQGQAVQKKKKTGAK